MEDMAFQDLVTLAVNINNNLTLEKATQRTLVVDEVDEGVAYWGGADVERACLIMGIPLKKYLDEAEKQGCRGKCFNCFGVHKSALCKRRDCKFCEKQLSVAGHYSLLCPKAPKNLAKFLEARRGEEQRRQEQKNSAVRIAEDFENFIFEDEDFSD